MKSSSTTIQTKANEVVLSCGAADMLYKVVLMFHSMD